MQSVQKDMVSTLAHAAGTKLLWNTDIDEVPECE